MWGYGACFARPIPPHLETTTGNPKDPKLISHPTVSNKGSKNAGRVDRRSYRNPFLRRSGFRYTPFGVTQPANGEKCLVASKLSYVKMISSLSGGAEAPSPTACHTRGGPTAGTTSQVPLRMLPLRSRMGGSYYFWVTLFTLYYQPTKSLT
jgi:hypothetical protein